MFYLIFIDFSLLIYKYISNNNSLQMATEKVKHNK